VPFEAVGGERHELGDGFEIAVAVAGIHVPEIGRQGDDPWADRLPGSVGVQQRSDSQRGAQIVLAWSAAL
jgi:hypothetical protein